MALACAALLALGGLAPVEGLPVFGDAYLTEEAFSPNGVGVKDLTVVTYDIAVDSAQVRVLLAQGGAAIDTIRAFAPEASGLHALPFGLGIGGNAVIMPVLVGRCFGELHFSRIMGLLMTGFAAGVVVGIPGAGWIFDTTGSYEWVLIVCAIGLGLAALLASLVRPERHHAEFEPGE